MRTAIQNELDDNIPLSAIITREAWRGGPKLSYISGAYVIDRLNKVLGQGNWGYTISTLSKVFEGTIQQQKGEAFTVSYIATVNFTAIIDTRQVTFMEVGYGDGTDMKSQGKANELATKEAVTDGVKRAAKNLGISMGLGLYFKSQEYIGESEIPKVSRTVTTAEATPVTNSSNTTVQSEAATALSASSETQPQAAKKTSLKTTKQLIKQAFGVLQAQKKVTKEQFVTDFTGGIKVDTLTDEAASITLNKIKTSFPELGLQ